MVKIFVGNLSSNTTKEDLRSLFSQYGKISECDVLRNFGFVHMDNKEEAEEAVSKLHHHDLNGQSINVEMSRGKPKGTTKLHVSNISSDCTNQELRAKFEEYGPVVECDIVKDYAFVHMERKDDAMEAISMLNNSTFQGKVINVQLSTSRLRTVPGMGDLTGCYVCGEQGHWSKDCRRSQNGSYGIGPMVGFHGGRGFPRGGPGYGRGGPGMFPARSYPPGLPPGPPMGHQPSYGVSREYGPADAHYLSKPVSAYPERPSLYERDHFGGFDCYEKFHVRPFGVGYFEDRRLSIPPPPPPPPPPPAPPSTSSSLSRMRLVSSGVEAYDRRTLPPSPQSTASAFYSRDRSPIRRIGTGSEDYSYERSRLSPVARSTTYAMSQSSDAHTERARYAF